MNKSAPDLKRECPAVPDPGIREDIEHALELRHQDALDADERITVTIGQGPGAAFITARVGPPTRPHEFTVFAREIAGDDFDGALGVVVDYLDGVLEEYFAGDREGFLPLDFEGRPFEEHIVFVRSDVRNLEAERLADALLNDSAPEID